MNINYHSFPARKILAWVQHYDAEKYWGRREYVIHVGGGKTSQVGLSHVHKAM